MSNVKGLLDAAMEMPHGPARVAVCEEAVRLADAAGDEWLGYAARDALIRSAEFAEREELLPVAFAWNLAFFDRHADELDPAALLDTYRRVMWWVPHLIDVPKQTVVHLFADLERRMREHGDSMREFHSYRRQGMTAMKDFAAAEESHLYLQRDPLKPWECDPLSAASEECEYLCRAGRYDDALRRAGPALKSDRTTGVEPQQLLSTLLMALLKAGRRGEAEAAARKAVRLIRKDGRQYPGSWCEIARFYVLTNQLPAAGRVLEEKLAVVYDRSSKVDRPEWSRLGLLFAEGLRLAGESAVSLRLPAGAPASVDGLAEWFRADLADCGGRHDARNGNAWWAESAAAVPAELEWARGRFWT